MRVLESLIEYIFNRNACLLPSYLIINEIRKVSENQNWPHWVNISSEIQNYLTE